MLRQLARLTRAVDVPAGALAIAVYSDDQGRAISANESGPEGVACVDDAARAVVLLCGLWEATRSPTLRGWAEGLAEFVLSMQDGDGRFVNFIADWAGRQNKGGPTSGAGGDFWHARGLRALVAMDLVLGDERASEAVRRALPHLRAPSIPPDVRVIHVLTALELLRAGRHLELRADLAEWSEELAACRSGDVLMDNPDQLAPHLWGHLQEGALAEAGAYLERPDLVAIARRSAMAYLAPRIRSGFDVGMTQPYGVACALFGVERLADRTGESVFRDLATDARAWFGGRNPTGEPVFDRTTGRVHDGIDGLTLNRHSGAESNIVGAEVHFAELVRDLSGLMPEVVRALPDLRPARPVAQMAS